MVATLYYEQISNKINLEKYVCKWARDFENNLSQEDFLRAVVSINKLTISTKLRSFQYKLLLRAIITNVHLKHYNVLTSNNCTFCNLETENYAHLFYFCESVRKLWEFIEKKCNCILSYENVILNRYLDNPKLAVNSLILFIKYFIYRQRCLKGSIAIHVCVNYLNENIIIEEQIAKNKKKHSEHLLKWENFHL